MDINIPKFNYTGDFQTIAEANPNMWAGTAGGKGGTKRLEEIDFDQNGHMQSDHTNYLPPQERNRIQSILNNTIQNQTYGTAILHNMGARHNNNTNMTDVKTDDGQKINIQRIMGNNSDVATTPAVLPADLTTQDRMMAAPEYEVGAMTNPNTLGDSLGTLVEKVHSKTKEYESSSNQLMAKNKGSAIDVAKDSMFSDYKSLSGVEKQEDQKSDIERQIEGFMDVMNGSYEYYIYSSLMVDSGKSISQTAQTLTKG